MVDSVSNSQTHAHFLSGSVFGDILSSLPNPWSCSAPRELSGRHCSSLSCSFGYVLGHMASVFLSSSQPEELSDSYVFWEMKFFPNGLSKAREQGQGHAFLQRFRAEVRLPECFLAHVGHYFISVHGDGTQPALAKNTPEVEGVVGP